MIVDAIRTLLRDQSGVSLLLGCSGGVDSMVLARALVELDWPFEMAHVNYGLRSDAGADQALVEAWSARCGVPLHVFRVDGSPAKGSLQAWARDVRYRYFEDLARRRGLSAVAVAHHADDQAETVALARARGGGLDGLSGMAQVGPLPLPRPEWEPAAVGGGYRRRPRLLRPLLRIDRSTIVATAAAWKVPFRTDSSNADMRFARAAVRHDMTAHQKDELLETARLARAQVERWTHALPPTLRAVLDCADKGMAPACQLPLLELQSLSADHRAWYVLRLAAGLDPAPPRRKSWVHAVQTLMDSAPGARLSAGTLEGIRDRDALVIYSEAFARHMDAMTLPVELYTPRAVGESVDTAFGTGTCRLTYLSRAAGTLWLDPDSVRGPLRLRRWQPGDRFVPLGGPGHTKVKEFLVDCSVEPSRKPYYPVLEDDVGIVCIPGHRAAERFRVTDPSKPVLGVEWEPDSVYFPPAL